jgi:hypothetical protein
MSIEALGSLPSQNPKFVEQVFLRVYQTRLDGPNQTLVSSIANEMQIEELAVREILKNVIEIIAKCVYEGWDEQEIANEYGGVVGAVLSRHVEKWREQALQTQVRVYHC